MKNNYFTLKNKNGMELKVSDIGGTVVSLTAPDKNGKFANVVLCPDDLSKGAGYMGAIIGRVGNRIKAGRFSVGGKRCAVTKNEPKEAPKNTLHGGKAGFDVKRFDVRQFQSPEGPAIEFTRISPDGEEGFPGNLFVRVVYTLTDKNAWRIEYWALTDAPTVVNLTQHAYFNLNGGKTDILGHRLQLFCDYFTPTDKELIPTGEVAPVDGTPMDFRRPVAIGKRIHDDFEPLSIAGGYDHNYLTALASDSCDDGGCDCHGEEGFVMFARAKDPDSGRAMECWTTEPCVQLYTGNFLDGTVKGNNGLKFTKHLGFCLETQAAPDSPNHEGFPCIDLFPGEIYHSKTEYRFK